MKFSPRTQNVLLVFVCLALVPFIRLGEGDLRGDEVIYAARARDIVAHGNFLPDVSFTQLKGYQPPFGIWRMSALIGVLGFSTLTVRLLSVVSTIVILIATYLFARRLLPVRGALGAAALLVSSPLLFHFSQLAQMEVPWLAPVTLAFAVFAIAREKKRPALLVFTGTLFGLSLNTVAFASIIPMAALFCWAVKEWRSKAEGHDHVLRDIAIVFGVALIVALPWHLWMIMKHGIGFIASEALDVQWIQGGRLGLDALHAGILALPGVLFLSYALSGLVGVYAVYLLWNAARSGPVTLSQWERLLWIWLLIPILLMIYVRGVSQTFVLLTLPPLAVLSFVAVEVFSSVKVGLGWRIAALVGVVASAASLYLAVVFLCAAVAVLIIASMLRPGMVHWILWRVPTYGAALFVLLRVGDAALDTSEMRSTGARTIAESIPATGSVILVDDGRPDLEVMQFHCYDTSRTLYQRMRVVNRMEPTPDFSVIPDSIRRVIVVKPEVSPTHNPYENAIEENLESQQFVLLTQTPRYELYARGLMRDP